MRPLPSWRARRIRCVSPPREGGRAALEGEIAEADCLEEVEAALELAEGFFEEGEVVFAVGSAR